MTENSSSKQGRSFLANKGVLQWEYSTHNKFANRAKGLKEFQENNGGKILLMSIIDKIWEISVNAHTGTMNEGWDKNKIPKPQTVRANLRGSSHNKIDTILEEFESDLITRLVELREVSKNIANGMKIGSQLKPAEPLIVGTSDPKFYGSEKGTSFVHEMLTLPYSYQLRVMAKLTTMMQVTDHGKQLLADLIHPSRGPFDVLDFFSPPTKPNRLKNKKVKFGDDDKKVSCVGAKRLVNQPQDKGLFIGYPSGSSDFQLGKYSGAGEYLVVLGNNLLPGITQLRSEGEHRAAAHGLGMILNAFAKDKHYKAVDSSLKQPLSRLKGESKRSRLSSEFLLKLSTASVKQWSLFNEISNMVQENHPKGLSVVGGSLKMLLAGVSLISRVFAGAESNHKRAMQILGDVSGTLSAIHGLLDEFSPENARISSFLPFSGTKWTKLLAWAGPVSDVIGTTFAVQATISEMAQGDQWKAVAKGIGAFGGILTLSAGFAAVSGPGFPLVAAVGVGLAITSLIWDLSLGNKGLVASWINNTYFGEAYDQNRSMTHMFYDFDGPDGPNFLEQIGTYMNIMQPLAGHNQLTQNLNEGFTEPLDPSEGSMATATVQKNSQKFGGNKSYVGILKLPVIGGGTDKSHLAICPIQNHNGVAQPRWGSRKQFAFPASGKDMPNWEPDHEQRMAKHDFGLAKVQSRIRTNSVDNDVSGPITSMQLRFESNAVSPIFGFRKSEHKNAGWDPYVRVRHFTPDIRRRIYRHANNLSSSKFEDKELADLYRMAPTSYIPINNGL